MPEHAFSLTPAPDLSGTTHPVVLFDGVCNLCNASVTFLIDRDPEATFRFAPLQSDVGRALVADCDLEGEDSIVLVEDGRCYIRSDAALRIAGQMRAPWPLLRALRVVPRPLRDFIYRGIAARRYRWFGKEAACRLPTPDLKRRFLDFTLE